jgi:heptosyltransferase-1
MPREVMDKQNMRVLVVKTSSMGDVIHTLPALTDARKQIPGITFDWVVEEAFSEVPHWHPAVDEVIPVAIRRWRKQIWRTIGSNEWHRFKTRLRQNHYDVVIDCQGLLKSAWIGKLINAPMAGYHRQSVREPLASWFYAQKHRISKEMHAVERIRQLFSSVLAYDVPYQAGDYGLALNLPAAAADNSAYVVFLHASAREEKLYPVNAWRNLARKLVADGYGVKLPWGSLPELVRAREIAEDIDGVEILPKTSLRDVAAVLHHAEAVVAVDTGLGHLAAALNVPTLSLYGPTRVELIGTYGQGQRHLCARDINPVAFDLKQPFAVMPSELVYQQLQRILPLHKTPRQTPHRVVAEVF